MAQRYGEPTFIALPPGGDFLLACARHLLAAEPDPLGLSSAQLILPNLLLAADMRAALARLAGGAVLMPRMQTLPAALEPWMARQPHVADSRRLFALYHALKARRWLDEGSLWEVCAELVALFDELTLAGVGLPPTLDEFQARLAAAYESKVDEPLRFEARLVHVLWQADGQGLPSRAAARLLAGRAWADALQAPLYAIAEGPPGAFEHSLYAACAAQVPVTVFVPDRRLADAGPGLTLKAAWPPAAAEAAGSLARRAAVAREGGASLAGRVRLLASQSLEQEAVAITLCVRQWLVEGKRRIALVAADRVAARRARALLERDGVLMEDETGWKLSTTRAAALVDAWLAVLSSDGYHRDVLDLLKSPFVGEGLEPGQREAGAEALARLYVSNNLAAGLDALRDLAGGGDGGACAALLVGARDAFPRSVTTPAHWLQRLSDSLEALGATARLATDGAGAELLAWLDTRRAELMEEGERIGFFEWREWLDRELESAMFRARSIDSPVIVTHLAAARLRRFEAAVIIGADTDNLAADDRRPVFAHEAVRAELGLPGRAAARARLLDDLAGLIALSDEVVVSWQHLRNGEIVLPCDAIELLSLLHAEAFGDDLLRPVPQLPPAAGAHLGQPVPAPVLPAASVPGRISASGLASLIACPYQYFARQVLGLGQTDEVSEALEKSDYGQMVHAILQAFHARFPHLAGHPDEVLLAALEEESERHFGPALARNFLEHAWSSRWLARLPAYLAWQRARESEGWHFAAAEQVRERDYVLADGAGLRLHGRLDRIDTRDDGALAVLDYKSRAAGPLRKQVQDSDDVQLAVYTLLQGEAVGEAAYVALDDVDVAAVPVADPAALAEAQEARLLEVFNAMRAGAPLPAHGAACDYCEMRGLCRKDFHS